jgi:hypothetical protein
LATRFPGAPRIGDPTSTFEQPLETLLADLDRPSADLARQLLAGCCPKTLHLLLPSWRDGGGPT